MKRGKQVGQLLEHENDASYLIGPSRICLVAI
jgi:hypothetical protein